METTEDGKGDGRHIQGEQQTLFRDTEGSVLEPWYDLLLQPVCDILGRGAVVFIVVEELPFPGG